MIIGAYGLYSDCVFLAELSIFFKVLISLRHLVNHEIAQRRRTELRPSVIGGRKNAQHDGKYT